MGDREANIREQNVLTFLHYHTNLCLFCTFHAELRIHLKVNIRIFWIMTICCENLIWHPMGHQHRSKTYLLPLIS